MINIARDFSRYPAGRFRDDGRFSGQRFREEFLEPAIRAGKTLVIELDGTLGYGSSFLEEAFGGLKRLQGLVMDDVRQRLTFRASDTSLIAEIQGYISA